MDREQRDRELRAGVKAAILGDGGALDRRTRERAFNGVGAPGAIAEYVATVQRNAYRVHDDMIAAVRHAGLDDRGIFELTVATAVGEATRQFEAAMAALEA